MKIYKYNIKLAVLQKIPEEERALFVLSGHVLNELNILNKTIHLCLQVKNEHRCKSDAQATQMLFFSKLLAGKLWESWLLLSNSKKSCFDSKEYRQYQGKLNKTAENSHEKLKTYFKDQNNLIKKIRNSYAFHYPDKNIQKDIELVLKKDRNEEELVMYLSDDHGNSLYYFSEYIINYALLENIENDQPKQAIERLIRESCEVCEWFIDILDGIMIHISEKYILENNEEPLFEEINLVQTPIDKDIENSYFFAISQKPKE